MRWINLKALMGLTLLLSPSVALATVNYGDFLGTQVDFLQVSETTQTAGDPEPIWDAPVIGGSGDQLQFFPTAFNSSCATPNLTDTTQSLLATTIMAQAGVHIETLMLQEAGDTTLTAFPPFGNPGTNTTAGISGTVTVIETTSGPIAPVVIPFTGTFTPSDTFALPTNFGSSAWTGSISIDVAAVVPLATKVEFALTNTLGANCDVFGNNAASISKKSVAGPSVALTVNPVACDLEIDKTCCVTKPGLPDLGVCEGDMVNLVLEYTGDKCRRSSNDQGRAFKCYGRRSLGDNADISLFWQSGNMSAVPSTDVDRGEIVTISSSSGTLDSKTRIKTVDQWWRKQYVRIDTSCNRSIQCGDTFGAYEVVGFESTLGGIADCNAPPPPPVCIGGGGDPVGTQCDAKVIDMVLEYNGQACQVPLGNPQGGNASCSGDATGATDIGIVYTGQHSNRQMISPSSGINDGDRVRVTSTFRSGMHPNQSYKIVNSGGVLQRIDFHTSCSQPLALGDEFGSFKLVEFTTKNGTTAELGTGGNGQADACEVPLAPPGPHCTSDLQSVTFVYIGDLLGEGCSVSNSQAGLAYCSGSADPGDPVAVATDADSTVDPIDQIEFGDLVTLTSPTGGDLAPYVRLYTTGAGGTQTVGIKTSCHKKLSLGDRFGAWVVFGMDREDEGPISLGGNVQYQYKVTNPNTSTVSNVAIDDDQLGTIVSGVTLTAGEMQTFVLPATLLGTTTNVATVTGDVNGDVCNPGVDQVTVNVTAPPPGSFHCSEPINELTMVWNGSQTVQVNAWAGNPGASVLLKTFAAVAPGDAITVGGLGVQVPTWEVLDLMGAPLGQSKFDLWCSDWSMNGVEDCGKANGNLAWNDPGLLNDWLLEGMVDTDETLACTPGLVPQPPTCGFGPELMLVLPGLLLLHRRRLKHGA